MMRWPFVRDIALFLGGMAGVVHETLLTKAERPTLLIMFAAMMGLPAFLQPGIQREESHRHKAHKRPHDDTESRHEDKDEE